ncbi:ABC transporter permease subunit [Paenibacillus lignilyticus]|uniref:Sugar ABC transporter permease n=1 Tax=Paenibacillus lignilyticus TaxID=1172615 RepID=A0ABS5CGV4_9BACL|nr:sugar ABC transporter permease [Paenibacillus lignilyticus]
MQPTIQQANKKAITGERESLWKRFRGQWDIQLMIIPGLVLVFVFSYIPMYGIIIAFQDYNIFKGAFQSDWVGIKHFRMFFESPDFWKIMRNTIVISLLKLLFSFPAPIALALMLNEVGRAYFKRVMQTISYLPHFLSWVIVSGFVISMLSTENGSINMLLEKLGLIDEPVNWMTKPEYFWSILIASNVWKEIGFASIVYLAAIAGIDPHLYESAAMDGAGRIRQMISITIPSIMPVILIFLILAIGNLMSAGFEDILMLTNNGSNAILLDVGEVIDTYVFRMGLQNERYSFAAAVGLFKAVFSVGLLVGANMLARRAGHSLW